MLSKPAHCVIYNCKTLTFKNVIVMQLSGWLKKAMFLFNILFMVVCKINKFFVNERKLSWSVACQNSWTSCGTP